MANVTIPQHEYELLKKQAERADVRSGRMSLRVPQSLYKLLLDQSAKTGVPKSEIVVNALRKDLGAAAGGLFE